MTIQEILAGEGSTSVYFGLMLETEFDEAGEEIPPVNPTQGKGGVLSLEGLGYCIFNTGKGSYQTTYKAQESNPRFLGWLLASPTNSNLLTIV